MVALNFNAAQVAPQTAMEPVPSGNYIVMITNSAKKPTSKGDGAYYEFEMTIQAGEFKGRKVFDRLNIENPNQQAVQIAYSTLSAMCYVTGRMQITQTEQLHGVPFTAVVIKKPRNDQPDVMTNEVKGYKDVNGNDPGKAPAQGGAPAGNAGPTWGNNNGQPANMQAQPQQQQQMQPQQFQDPNAGGAPAWQQQQQPQQGQPAWQGQPQQGQPAQGGAPAFDPNAPPPWAAQ